VNKSTRVISALLFVLGAGADSVADPLSLQVTINTTPLQGLGQFSLDFQFLDGDGIQNNSVVLSGFDFVGGGGPIGVPTLVGGAAGSIASSIALTDTEFFNALTQPFTAGPALVFSLALTTNAAAAGSPDRFALAILDASGAAIPTTGLAEELLGIDITRPLTMTTSGSDLTRTALDLSAPAIQAVPEPSTVGLLALAVSCYAAARRK
jgi:hypothetical protein